MQIYRNFTEAYYDLVEAVYNEYDFTCAPRGQKIREILGASFVIQDPRNRLLQIPERKFSLQYVIAEILWYMLGDDKTDWIGNYSTIWKNISDDGVTANSAYGSRIFKPHPKISKGEFTQWQYVKDELTRDPDSRRAVIHIRTPEDSIHATKDVPCTLSLQFFIREKKLMLLVNMRSTDLIFGLGNDVPAFTFMQEMMAKELGVELGPYIHVSNSLHVYERHFEMCEQILKGAPNYNTVPMPMPEIPGEMPVTDLDAIQAVARMYEDPKEIVKYLDFRLETLKESLWRDWARILVIHRLQKLNADVEKNSVVDQIEFEGFRRFL